LPPFNNWLIGELPGSGEPYFPNRTWLIYLQRVRSAGQLGGLPDSDRTPYVDQSALSIMFSNNA
jgi:hypothetical protein